MHRGLNLFIRIDQIYANVIDLPLQPRLSKFGKTVDRIGSKTANITPMHWDKKRRSYAEHGCKINLLGGL